MPIIFGKFSPSGVHSLATTYGLTSVNNSCKKAIRPAVFYSNMNPRDKYHNIDKQHKHYEHTL